MLRRHCSLALLSILLAPFSATAQQLASIGDPPVMPSVATARTAVALRVARPPVLDGKDDDPIWREAQTIDAFRQWQPLADTTPSFRTVAKIAYDDRYLYVLVRMYDPHPDSIVALLSRRDVRTPSDQIKVMIDSYHDRRTGYEFAVNPIGVKRDYYTFDDNNEDDSWDGVWDVATAIDSLGWVAEYRIPFSQLRFPKAAEHTFGVQIVRDIARFNERDAWPVYDRAKSGIASQFGEVSGIRGLGSPRRLEILPYFVTKNVTREETVGWSHPQQLTGGADVKYGVTSNLTLDATINPDFGQVEADPAVLNLSGFETFFPEKRPFFIEGTGILRFDVNCNNGSCSGLFYSRRIGREPQLTDGDASTPTATTILGAAKLTGRLGNGLSVGVLDAATQRETGAIGQTVEPRTNYFVGRLLQDFRAGGTSIGAMVTAVNRQLDDDSSRTDLRRAAYTGGIDARHRFHGNNLEIKGFIAASRIEGSDSAIALTQRNSTHYYQRPGDGARYDPSRTALGGDAEKLSFGKIGGGITRFNTTFSRYSPGFEINDVGFLQRAGTQSWSNWFGLQFNEPRSFYRQLFVNFNQWNNWGSVALSGAHLTDNGANINADAQLRNSWWLHGGIEMNRFLPVYDDRASRGGPALRRVPFPDGWFGIEGDDRLRVAPSLFVNWFRGPRGRSWGWGVDPSVKLRLTSSFTATLSPHFDHNSDDNQWIDNFERTVPLAGGSSRVDTAYTFGHLDQNTASLTARIDYTVRPTLSIQVYAQPFVTSGRYTNWRELNQPRSETYGLRYKPYSDGSADGVSQYNFDFAQFRSNWVVRWEYRRGSALFFVWTQGRNFENDGALYGRSGVGANARDLFAIHPDNTFLVKMSYWFSP